MKIKDTSKYADLYYQKHKAKIDKVFGKENPKYANGKLDISAEQRFKAQVYAKANTSYNTAKKANEDIEDIVIAAQHNREYAEQRRQLINLKEKMPEIDLRKKEYKIESFESYVMVPDEQYIVSTNFGDWNGGVDYTIYLDEYSVNRTSGLVMWKGHGATTGSDKQSPFSASGMITIDELEDILGYEVQ